jgi:hypothetical protein
VEQGPWSFGSHATLDSERGQDQDEGIDDAPRKRDPGGHAKVASSIDTTQQATNDIAGNQGFNGTDCAKDDWGNPDELPVAPLDGHGKGGSDKVDADDINDGPEKGEAPYVV